MSYDMLMVYTPEALPEGYVPPLPEQNGRFLISNRAMYAMEDVMTIAGVLDTACAAPVLPNWPPEGISQKRIDKLGAVFCVDGAEVTVGHDCLLPLTGREERIFEGWAEKANAVLTRRSDQPGKVPAYKFQSQQNWFVCPEECLLIGEGLMTGLKRRKTALSAPYVSDGMGPRTATAWVRRWAVFNQIAAGHGGYRVF